MVFRVIAYLVILSYASIVLSSVVIGMFSIPGSNNPTLICSNLP